MDCNLRLVDVEITSGAIMEDERELVVEEESELVVVEERELVVEEERGAGGKGPEIHFAPHAPVLTFAAPICLCL